MVHIVTDAAGRRLGVAGAIIDLASESDGPPSTVVCKGCDGTSTRYGGQNPDGWYSLTVSVPRWVNRKGYAWVAQFCSAACIARAMPRLEYLEKLAREAYDPVPPDHRAGAR